MLPTDTATPSLLSAPVQALLDAVEAVAAQAPVELPGPQALADAAAVLRAVESLQAVTLVRVADVDRRSLHVLGGALSTGQWVQLQGTSLSRDDIALSRRLASFPAVAEAVAAGRLSITGAGRVTKALASLRRHVDRPDGLIDGQPGTEVVTAVVVDGIRQLVCEARAGLADSDPLLVWLTASLAEIANRPVSELARLEAGFVLLARHIGPALLPSALGRLVDAVLPNELERKAADGHAQRGLGLSARQTARASGSPTATSTSSAASCCSPCCRPAATSTRRTRPTPRPGPSCAPTAGSPATTSRTPPAAPDHAGSATTTRSATPCGATSTPGSPACARRSRRTWSSPSASTR